MGSAQKSPSPAAPLVAQRSTALWWGAMLLAATLAAYWPALSAGFIWDDDAYVTENPLLSQPDGLARIWFSAHSQSQYFPLVFTTLRWEYALWGLNPLGYHAVNVAVHMLNALLVWKLLRRLALPGAWLAAAVFALHPVQVETVAWVTELKNTESTLFYLLAVFAWLRFCEGRGGTYYALALVLQVLALFAKTTACTLPAALFLVLWLRHQPVPLRRLAQILPFFAVGVGLGLLSVWWEKHLGNYEMRFHLLGGPLDRVLIASHALWFYAGKLCWPFQLTFSYPRWEIDIRNLAQYGWLLAGAGLAGALWWGRQRLGRMPLAGIVFFVAALSPMVGFIPLYTFYFSYVADHYQYLACLGLIAPACGLAASGLAASAVGRRVQAPLAAGLLLCLGGLTWHQCGAYRNLQTLWEDTLRKNPRSWMAHTNLGRLLAQQKQYDAAEGHYLAALAIYTGAESVHYNYGNLLVKTKRLDEAVTQYHQAIQIAPEKPETHNNLGIVLNQQHRTEEAIAEYQQAIACKPDYAEAYYNLGNALSAGQRMDAAIAAYQQAVRLNPESEIFRKRLQAVAKPSE